MRRLTYQAIFWPLMMGILAAGGRSLNEEGTTELTSLRQTTRVSFPKKSKRIDHTDRRARWWLLYQGGRRRQGPTGAVRGSSPVFQCSETRITNGLRLLWCGLGGWWWWVVALLVAGVRSCRTSLSMFSLAISW